MGAGGRLILHDLLRSGDDVLRYSRIANVQLKRGRTGPLCFVAVDHTYSTSRGPLVEERQDIVYREAASAPEALAGTPADEDRPGDVTAVIDASPLLLFRYSALTFNGHRIHYDRTYATLIEHYPGLVVHGPLQATLALRLAAALHYDQPLRRLSYRGLAPLIDGSRFRVRARPEGTDGARLSVIAADGRETMAGQAAW
jgi:3-methylfumaryl-CoA hydratase